MGRRPARRLELERPSFEHAPRQRDAQHLVERQVDHHCGNDRDQRRAGQRIVDFYLASPTALSAAPRFVSDAAMNLAVSCGSAQTTPKPRLAMKSLYSFES